MYETFKNTNKEQINPENQMLMERRAMKRSQKFMMLRMKAGTEQRMNMMLTRSFDH